MMRVVDISLSYGTMLGHMNTLRLFVDVARCHSFSQAAALHGISQSAASQRVHQLEKQLGVKLIDRSQRPLQLTEAGDRFFTGCEDVLSRYDRLEQSVTQAGSRPAGAVRIAAIYSAGIELLHDVRERLRGGYPDIEIDLVYEHPEAIHQMVKDHEVDLGIVSYPEHWRGVSVIHLRDEAMAVICRPQHQLAEQEAVTPADLRDQAMVCLDADLPAGRRVRQYLREQGVHVKIIESFDNIDTAKSAVAATGHIAILPWRTVLRELEAGTLEALPLQPALFRPLGVIYRKRHGKQEAFSPAVRVVVDDLVKRSAEDADATPPTAARRASEATVG